MRLVTKDDKKICCLKAIGWIRDLEMVHAIDLVLILNIMRYGTPSSIEATLVVPGTIGPELYHIHEP